MRLFRALFFCPLFLHGITFVVTDGSHAQHAVSWEQVLDWLPPDTETFIVAQGVSPIAKDKKNGWLKHWLSSTAAGWHIHPELRKHLAALENCEVHLAVEGARCFRAPGTADGLGYMRYEGCHITVFAESARDVLRDYFSAMAAASDAKFQLVGENVLHLQSADKGPVIDTFLVRPRPDALLIATDKGYLEEVLRRIKVATKPRPLPSDDVVWKHVDTSSPVWAVPHQRYNAAELKRGGPKGHITNLNDDALTLMVMPDKPQQCRLRQISKEPPPPDMFSYLKKERPFRPVSPGVWELTIDMDEAIKDPEPKVPLMLISWLGHAIVI